MIVVLCLTTILAGCATSSPEKPQRTLPPAPDYLRPVAPPKLKAGQDARAAVAQHRAALGQANTRLANTRTWYECVRTSYGDETRKCAAINR